MILLYLYSRDVMLEGGTAVDGAIAGLFCNGVYSSQVINTIIHH